MRNFLFYNVVAIIVLLSSVAAGVKKDVRLLSSTQEGLVIEYTPRYDEPITVTDGNNVFQRWSFEGATAREAVQPGNPDLPIRSLSFILPGSTGHNVEVLSTEYETLSDILLQPVAKVEGDFENIRRTYPMGEAYQSSEFMPSSVAGFQYTGVVRGYETGEVRISPLQYNPSSRSLRKYTRIVIGVNFGPATFQIRRVEDPLMKDLSVNYATAKGWKAIQPAGAVSQYRSSVFKTGEWRRFSITESGMYKLSGAALIAAFGTSNINPRNVKIYSNGGIEPPADAAAPYPDDVTELSVYVFDGGTTGQLDASDYIIFYGQGPRGWSYNSAGRTFNHWINLYSNVAYYWVTYDGNQSRAMTSANSIPGPADFSPTTVLGKTFREDERVNILISGRQWLGQSLSHNGAVTYQFPLPGLDPSQIVRYRFSIGAKDHTAGSSYVITENNNPLTSVPIASSGNPANYDSPYVRMATVETSASGALLQNSQSQLRFSYTSNSGIGIGYIDWMEIFYLRQLMAEGDVFNFHSHDTTAIASYTINNFTQSLVWVFDVTRFDSIVHITDPAVGGGACSFRIQLSRGTAREFYVVGDNAFKTPGALQTVPNQDVHGDTTSVDLIIITHRDFLPAAQRLKQHRERPGPDQLTVRIVEIDHIYNEFSNGYESPLGVRNYLRYLNVPYTDSAPKYVLLFGDGHYDFRHINVPGPIWVPPWETHESFIVPLSTYATDDSLSILTVSNRVQVAMGRLPVSSLAEAHTVVDKIIEYETTIDQDPWKLRLTYVADDGFQEGTLYTNDTEGIAENQTYTPSLFEKQKIYSAGYPLVSASAGRRRPAVNQAIVDAINRGTLLLNFIGHGNPRVWTHEQVFVREDDIPRLRNKGKYFLVVAATCNYSQYDDPSDQSSGELLVVMRDAGAIATLSASRPVFHSPNIALAQSFFKFLFMRDSTNNLLYPRLGDAIFKAKQERFGENDRKFLLLGDPSLRFAIPRRNAGVDSLNGYPGSTIVQFRALDSSSVVGNVRDADNQPTPNFSGTSLVTIYDADRRITINKPGEMPDPDLTFLYTYTAAGGILFRGQSSIESGRFASSFIVPRDISYDTTRPGRISLYFWNETEEGAGVTRNIRVGGSNPNPVPDSTGPTIYLYLDNRNFRPGDLVSDNPLLIADLYDEHGINTSNIGLGHSIEMWVDNQSQSVDLSDYYKGELDSYQRGTVEYPITGLSPGSHRVRLRAWDTYNNSSMLETNFDVGYSVGLQIWNVFNYPNPFANTTTFTFQHNQLVPVEVEVKVYTVAGRLIETLTYSAFDMFVTVPWNGRDRDGDEIANGVYLYKIIVRTQDGRFTSETLGKLSKVR
jgi:hypothetical protein